MLVFIPALVAVLLNKERAKGIPLTEEEVLSIRDQAACMVVPRSAAAQLDDERGYDDVDPEKVWDEWQIVRSQLEP